MAEVLYKLRSACLWATAHMETIVFKYKGLWAREILYVKWWETIRYTEHSISPLQQVPEIISLWNGKGYLGSSSKMGWAASSGLWWSSTVWQKPRRSKSQLRAMRQKNKEEEATVTQSH